MSALFLDPCLHSVALKQQRPKSLNTKCHDKKFDADVFQYHFKVINYYKDFFVTNY